MKARTERKHLAGRIFGFMLIMILAFAVTVMADVPGAVSLTKAKVGSKQVKLTWKAAAGAKGYHIYKVSGSTKSKLGTVNGASATTGTIKKLKNGKTYNFAVAAFNADGEGALSNQLEARPQFMDPGSLKEVRLYANKNKSCIIRWGSNANATHYQILTENADGAWVPITTVDNATFKLRIKGLKNGKIYKFRVRAVVVKGKQTAYGALSNIILARPIGPKKLKKAVGNIHPYYYKAKTLAKLTANGVTIKKGAKVTITKKTSSRCHITYKNKTYKVPTSALEITKFITKASAAPTKAEAEAFVNAKGYQSESEYLVWINTYTQHLYVFQGSQYNWVLVKEHKCSTGDLGYPTPIAVSQIHYKKKIWFFNKEDALAKGLDIQCGYWASRIKGGAIHSWMYNWSNEKRTTGKEPDGYPATEAQHKFIWSRPAYGKAKSHGCVRVPIELAKWIYDNVPVNSTNVTY